MITISHTESTVAFVMSHIDARVGERTQSAQVDVEYELPVQAVTETIVNACVHRDYLSTGSVQVVQRQAGGVEPRAAAQGHDGGETVG